MKITAFRYWLTASTALPRLPRYLLPLWLVLLAAPTAAQDDIVSPSAATVATAPTLPPDTAQTAAQVDDWQYHIAPPAGWVEVLDGDDDVEISGDALQVLLFDRQARLQPDGEYHYYFRLRQRVNNSAGLAEAGRLHITIQPSFQQLAIHDYSLTRNNRQKNLLDREKIELLRQEDELSSSIYTGSLSVVQIPEGLQVGDIVDYSITIYGRNPVLGPRFSDSWSMGWNVDVHDARLRLLLPANREFIIRADAALPGARTRHHGDYTEHTWKVEEYSGHHRPGDMPPWHYPYPLVEVSEYTTWGQVAAWGYDLYRPALGHTVNWPAATAIIGNTALDTKTKAVRLLNLVQQDIRYFGIETGVNALRPSPPLDTIQRLYGDCKDKSVVLTNLLNQAGIQANTVLVSADQRRGVAQRLPGPHVFDHAIVHADIDGSRYWLDPTATHQAHSLDALGFIDYGYTLPLDAGTTELDKVTAPALPKDAQTITQHFIIGEENIALAMDWTRHGRSAELARQVVDSVGNKEWDKAINSFYERLYAGLIADQPSAHRDDLQSNVYRSHHAYHITEPLTLVGTHWRLETYADSIKDFVELPGTLQREDPLYWSHPIRVEHNIEVDHERGLPQHDYEPIIIERDAFSYRREVVEEDERIVIRHEYISRADQVSVADLPTHIEGLRAANEALSLYVYLNSPEEERLNQRNENLKNKLRNLLRKK